MHPGDYIAAQTDTHREPDWRLDVSRPRRTTFELQQGREGLDDHNARPPYRGVALHCVRYLDTSEGLLVWGTASGAPRDPDWFRNLRKAKLADVQVGPKTMQVRPQELVGEQRDTAWNNIILTRAPEVAKYAERAGRTIPVAVLEPVQGPLRDAGNID